MNKNSIREPAVYGLFHDGRLFYVGYTTTNIQERMWQHGHRVRSGHSAPVYEYIRAVGLDNISIEIIQKINQFDNGPEIEAKIIKDSIDAGFNLQNQIARDGKLNSMSKESNKKISSKRKGKETWIKGKRGIEAGWTDERKAKHSKLKKDKRIQKHGTQSERKKYGCDCIDCLNWEIEYYREMESRKLKNQHGTVASYKHGKCRCDDCRTAYRQYQRRFYE